MAPAALVETWALYSVGSFAIFLRLFSRWRIAGISYWKPDDYLVILAWAGYTVMTAAAHIVGGTGDTSNIPLEVREAMTDAQRAARSSGSKWFMVGWYSYIVLIWTLKINMLFFYQRVVNGLWVEKFIKPVMLLVVCSGLSIIILLSTACRPFHKIWQVLPDPGQYCTPQSPAFLMTILVLNVFTDLMIMILPAPVILPIKTTVARKIGLYLLFGAGIFVMVAAILRVVFVLALGSGETAAIWSCREDLVAVCVGQAAMIRPLFTRRFWTSGYGQNSSSGYNSKDAIELSDGQRPHTKRTAKDPYSITAIDRFDNDSTEKIVETTPPEVEDVRRHSNPQGIVVQRKVDIESEEFDSNAQQQWKQRYTTTNNFGSGV